MKAVANPLEPIGDQVLSIDTWSPQRASPNDEFEYIDIAAVDRDRKCLTETTLISAADAPSRARQIVRSGDVLVSTVRPNLNAVAMVPDELTNAIASTGFCVLRCNPRALDQKFLFYWVRTSSFIGDMVRKATGASYPAVSDRIIKESKIPLPPLSEQKRIADILDKADAIRRKRQNCSIGFDDLLQSCFYTTFGDPLHNPLKWPVKSLGEVSVLDRGRSRHRPRDAAFLYGGPYPFVQTGDITNSNGFVRRYSQAYSDEGLAQSKLWPAGTLCITIAANIAKTAVLTFDACFPDSVVGLIPGESLTTEYVRHWFVAMEKAIDAAATQVAQKNINLQLLRDLQIQLPPLEMQKHFSDCVNAIRRSREQSAVATDEVDNLFNSLVQRAFQGEL